MLVLELLGTLTVRDDTRHLPPVAQQKRRVGLLAILALGGRQGMSRHRIEAYLWPDSDAARARHALDQAVYAIRRILGSDLILATGQELRLNPDVARADVWEFDDAIRAREWAAAVAIYKGTLLDGYQFGESRELEAWIDAERARVLLEYQTAIELLANRSAEAGDHSQDVTWRRKLASSDPLSAERTKKLMLALAAAGDRAGAVNQARRYQELVRQELEMEPDAEIERLVSTLTYPSATETASKPAPSRQTATAPVTKEPASSFAEGALAPAGSGGQSARTRLHTERWRIAALASFTLIVALVVGAFTVKSGQAENSLSTGAGNGARNRSRVPLPAAREAYLRGLNAWEDRTKDGLDNSVVYFRRATEIDPGYAEAHAELAEAYVRLGYFGFRPADAMFPKAKAAALRSLELDSTVASAHTALATALIWEHDFKGAESEFRKAISFGPDNAGAHQWYGVLLMILRRIPEAVAEEKRAAELAPLALQTQNNYATFIDISGDHAGALRHFEKMFGEEPDSAWVRRNPWLLANMSRVYANLGQYTTAIRMAERALEIIPTHPRAVGTLAATYAQMGRNDLANQVFARADTSNEQYAAYRGLVYADQGKADSAFLWFGRQKEWGIQPMLSLQADRRIDSMRTDLRFVALLKRLGLPTR